MIISTDEFEIKRKQILSYFERLYHFNTQKTSLPHFFVGIEVVNFSNLPTFNFKPFRTHRYDSRSVGICERCGLK